MDLYITNLLYFMNNRIINSYIGMEMANFLYIAYFNISDNIVHQTPFIVCKNKTCGACVVMREFSVRFIRELSPRFRSVSTN